MANNYPIRVLQVITGMGSGGAESFLMNMYRNINRELVQFDFLLRSSENIYKDEIEALGGRIYYTSTFPKHYFKNKREVREILNSNDFAAVHVHANALLYMTALSEAKRAGIPIRIMHSHNSSAKFKLSLPLHYINQKRLKYLATDFLACSKEAANWMFGQECQIIKNSVDINSFAFNESARNRIRDELNLSPNSFVIGHIGRFLQSKNHEFILDVFEKCRELNKESVLVLVGSGELFDKIKAEVTQRNLDQFVRFLGVRHDVNEVMSAFDTFIFPSKFEGLPLTLIEAQANGLPIFCSDRISSEAFVCDSIHVISLERDAEYWAKAIINRKCERMNNIPSLRSAGFDAALKDESLKLQNLYLQGRQ